jgi:excisionase family DNA binding protein
MAVMAEPLTLTVPQVAELLGISRGLAYEAARRGDLPTVKLGRRILVPRARLLALLGDLPASNGTKGGEPIEEGNGPGVSPSARARGVLNHGAQP